MPVPFLVIMIIFAHPSPLSLLTGLIIVFIGEFLRLWGVAIAGSETRTTGPVGGTFLITKGPFAFVRNPLYVGNILIYCGVGLMANLIWLVAFGLIFFTVQYSLIVSLEEEYLIRTFGDQYLRYTKAVPRFIPTIKKFTSGTNVQPDLDWVRGVISEKSTLLAITSVTIILIAFLLFRR